MKLMPKISYRPGKTATFERDGDTLKINGEAYDLSGDWVKLELEEGDGGYGFGLASAILSMNAPALSNMAGYRNPAFIAAMLVSLIMLIVYWSVIARYNRIFSLWGQ